MATGDPLAGRGEQTPSNPSADTGIKAPPGVTATPPRQPLAPDADAPAKPMLSQTQMGLAVAALVVMVFVVTFGMNFLGGGAMKRDDVKIVDNRPRRELTFFNKVFPPGGTDSVDREYRSKGHLDFWFQNPHDATLKVGLIGQSCKCTAVRLFYLPDDAPRRIVSSAVAAVGVSPAGGLSVAALQSLATPELQKGATDNEILRDKEAVEVPAHAVGWVRLVFTGEKAGPTGLTAAVWTENKDTGPKVELHLRLQFHEALRLRPALQVGTLKEDDLSKGLTRYIYCWSPTRPHLKIEPKLAVVRKGGTGSDPLQIGPAELLDQEETERLKKEVMTTGQLDPIEGPPSALMLCAYRVPVTMMAVAADGRTPFDLGPFRRRVVIETPDVEGEPKSVIVLGRVMGVLELGGEDESGDLNFRVFQSRYGKREAMTLSSALSGLKVEVDAERTSSFLKATLQPLPGAGDRQNWRLNVEVKPNEAVGVFPRKDDPLYEDCAVYLKATAPSLKEPRPIRIAVQGTGSGG